MRALTGWLLVAAGLAAVGCYVKVDSNREWIRDAASRDLNCPKGKIVVHHFTNKPHKKRADGCGRSGTWFEQCDGETCWWVRRDEEPPPPMPGADEPAPAPAPVPQKSFQK